MKILLLGSAYPFRGGLSNFNERLVREFVIEGHEAEIFTFTLQYPSILFPGKSQFSTDTPPSDIKITRKMSPINPVSWWLTGNAIRKIKPDILVIKYWLPFMAPCFGTIARIAKKNHHTRVITILDNVVPHEKRPGDTMLTKYFMTASDAFIAMSRSVLNDLKLFSKNKPVRFNPHPVYDNFGASIEKQKAKEHLGLDPSFHYLLFFGFIRKYKGLQLLLEAFADERLRKFPLKLIIAGEFYEDAKPYHDLISKLGLQDLLVLRTDFIPDAEVKNFFSAADIIIQPYLHATQSGVTQIAYHFGKPMIVTNVGGLSELVSDGKVGYVVAPESMAVADAIFDFYENKREALMSENVMKEKSKFSWGQLTRNIIELASV